MVKISMGWHQVRDYLNTQGLKLSENKVEMAVLAVQSVLQMAQAEIDPAILWYQEHNFNLAEKLGINTDSINHFQPVDVFRAEHENCAYILRQLYLAFDSLYSRHHSQSVTLYLYEANDDSDYLYRLINQGIILPAVIRCDEEQMRKYLFARTAATGWLNQIGNIDEWIADGSLSGEQHGNSQLALPVCNESGQVLGVIFVTHVLTHAITETELIDWIAMAIAIVPLINNMHSVIVPTNA